MEAMETLSLMVGSVEIGREIYPTFSSLVMFYMTFSLSIKSYFCAPSVSSSTLTSIEILSAAIYSERFRYWSRSISLPTPCIPTIHRLSENSVPPGFGSIGDNEAWASSPAATFLSGDYFFSEEKGSGLGVDNFGPLCLEVVWYLLQNTSLPVLFHQKFAQNLNVKPVTSMTWSWSAGWMYFHMDAGARFSVKF